MFGPISKVMKLYASMMVKHPLLTQCLSAGVLSVTGDAILQLGIKRQQQLDYRESLRYFCFGTFIGTPVVRTWYIILNKIAKPGSKYFALKKVFFDQAIFTPPFIASCLTLLRLFAGNSVNEVANSVSRDYKQLLFTNWAVWPLVQLVNFYFVPLNYQIIVVNAVAIPWGVFVAYIVERKPLPNVEILRTQSTLAS